MIFRTITALVALCFSPVALASPSHLPDVRQIMAATVGATPSPVSAFQVYH